MEKWLTIAIWIFAITISFGVNYCFALLGEPRSLWFMQLIGVM